MAGAFERLATSVLRHLGQDAFLLVGATNSPTTTPTRANIEFGVLMDGPYQDGMFPRDVATLPCAVNAKLGDRLVVGTTTYVLDGVVASNGHMERFSVTKV